MSKQFVVLDANTLSVIDWYCADFTYIAPTPGIRLEVPEGLTWDTVKGVQDGEEVTLVADSDKVAAKTQAQWTSLRTERNARLAATDWVALADAHLSQDKKDAWFAYRQELRDLPDLVTDEQVTSSANSVPWPPVPGSVPVVQATGSRLSGLLDAAQV